MPFTPDELRRIAEPPDLGAALRTLLVQIPAGCVTSFGDLAEALGDLSAARWVATELQELDAEEFPVHRVIRRTGKLVATANLSLAQRTTRLRQEGVLISNDTIDVHAAGWKAEPLSRPLEQLRILQHRLADLVTFEPLTELPARIAGVDVSYTNDRYGVAAYTIVETASGKLLHHEVHAAPATFPYIPGYLSFREIPLYLQLLETVRNAGRLEPWLLIDGTGILHPRRAGIATMLGCALSLKTIGVSKHLLFGKVASGPHAPASGERVRVRGNRITALEPQAADYASSPILDGETLLGMRLTRSTKRSTLYVAPGTGVDVAGALRVTESQLRGHRLPEPLYHADRMSREAARNSQVTKDRAK